MNLTQKQMNKVTKLIETQKIIKGRVLMAARSATLGTDVLQVEIAPGITGLIPKEEIDLREFKHSLVGFVGTSIEFVVTNIDESGRIMCSRKAAKVVNRDAIIERLEKGEEFEGKVIHLERYAAFISLEGTIGVLRNIDFAEDGTTPKDMLKVNDKIKVRLKKVSSNKRILVEAVEKVCNESTLSFESFEVGQIVQGVIRTIKTVGCFTCIAPNLDAFAGIPDYLNQPIEEGMKVRIKLTKVDPETRRVRGKIISIIDDSDDINLDLD